MTPAAGILARHATPADARAIAEIHVETWRDAYAAILPHKRLLSMSVRSHTAMWAEVLHRRGDPLLVAEDATGQPIGFGTCGPARGTRLEFRGEIYMLYVLPELQGSGAGRELLTGLGRCLIRRGMASALVWVLADNPARFFYEGLGGRLVAERTELFWGADVRERAYGWSDLNTVVRATGSRAAP